VGYLLHDEDDPDGGEEAFDDIAGEVVGKEARAEGAEYNLEEAADHQGEEEGLERAEAFGLGEDDGGEAGGGSGDADLGTAEGADNETADDAGEDAGDDGDAGGVGDAEAEGDSDEEDNQTCHEVLLEIVGRETVRHKVMAKGHFCQSDHPTGAMKRNSLKANPDFR
jgi:hypothetical protein